MKTKEWKGFGPEPSPKPIPFMKVIKNGKEYTLCKLPIVITKQDLELDAKKGDSTFISEKDYEPMECCICGAYMPTIHDTHNPAPYGPMTTAKMAKEDNSPSRCCSRCDDNMVLAARLGNLNYLKESEEFYKELRKHQRRASK
tara:strand:+ start:90 stop:518 length:429 start_codon:yes stop_codon:yes gene_type:complete